MTNEARIEELEKEIEQLKIEKMHDDIQLKIIKQQRNEAERDLAAQAVYAVKLREALGIAIGDFKFFKVPNAQQQGRIEQALSLTPTEAMKQAKEKYWKEGIEAGWSNFYLVNGVPTLDLESLLAELRKKEGL